jgi:hypothetical protein
VNQTLSNGTWVQLLVTNFTGGTNGKLRIRTTDTTGYVIADAARWLSTTVLPQVQLVPTDPIASETGKAARISVVRSSEATNSELVVHYRLAGTATGGVDIVDLPGTLLLRAGMVSTSLVIQALSDSIPEGDKELSVTLQPGTNYTVGPLSNAVVRIQDLPFDGWRFRHFTAAEIDAGISAADSDPDQDGASNWHEFQTGTDPRDGDSVLRINIDAVTNTARLSFSAAANHSYALQWRDRAETGAWADLTNYPPAAIAGTMLYFDALPAGQTNRYYRVQVIGSDR